MLDGFFDLTANSWAFRETGEAVNRRRRTRLPARGETLVHWIAEPGSLSQQVVKLQDRTPEGVGFRSPCSFQVGQSVWIELSGRLLKGTVRHCEASKRGYLVGLGGFPAERRQEVRQPNRESGVLEWDGRLVEAVVQNVSGYGMQVEVPSPIPASTVVGVAFGPWRCLGSVCYCKSSGEKFRVGLYVESRPTRVSPAAKPV